MSKVVIQGHASGTGDFTIAAPNSNTDRTLTLPDVAGTVLTSGSNADFPAGSVLQVVSTAKSDQFTTSSTSFTDVTGMSATITPTSSSSKILVIFSVGLVGNSNAGQFVYLQLVRDTTSISIGDASESRARVSAGNGGTQPYSNSSLTITNLDSPSTTSAVTYKIQMRSQSSGTAKFNSRGDDADSSAYGRSSASLTLMEIAQ
jgi:hypothetical protein